MGIRLNYISVPQQDLDTYKSHPKQYYELLGEEFEKYPSYEIMDIDKSWDGLHFMFNSSKTGLGEPNSLTKFIFPDQSPIPERIIGYASAMYIDHHQLVSWFEDFKKIDQQFIEDRLNPTKMKELELYPDIWDDSRENLVEYYWSWVEHMQDFFQKAIDNKHGLIITLE